MLVRLLCLLMASTAFAGDDLDLQSRFLLLSHKKNKAMQEDLDKASAAGYLVRTGTRTPDDRLNLILEKKDGKATYKLLAETDVRRIKSQVEQLAGEGYRVVNDAMMIRGKAMTNKEYLVLMEKRPDVAAREYRVLISEMDESLQSVLVKLADLGFVVFAMMPGRDDRQIVFMEK